MPVHDWSKVAHSVFHHFHTLWIAHLSEQINRLLPPDYYAMAEQHMSTGIGDVVTLAVCEDEESEYGTESQGGTLTLSLPAVRGIGVAERPPKVTQHLVLEHTAKPSERSRRILVRTQKDHRIVAVVEIVSPGNKDNDFRVQTFVEKMSETVRQGIHVLVIDLLPPGKFDPAGLHDQIWQSLGGQKTELQPELPLVLASYLARENSPEAFVEPTAPGRTLAVMPLFLENDCYIEVPLEDSYLLAWQGVPAALRPTLSA